VRRLPTLYGRIEEIAGGSRGSRRAVTALARAANDGFGKRRVGIGRKSRSSPPARQPATENQRTGTSRLCRLPAQFTRYCKPSPAVLCVPVYFQASVRLTQIARLRRWKSAAPPSRLFANATHPAPLPSRCLQARFISTANTTAHVIRTNCGLCLTAIHIQTNPCLLVHQCQRIHSIWRISLARMTQE
jgi:hypothetical protein